MNTEKYSKSNNNGERVTNKWDLICKELTEKGVVNFTLKLKTEKGKIHFF